MQEHAHRVHNDCRALPRFWHRAGLPLILATPFFAVGCASNDATVEPDPTLMETTVVPGADSKLRDAINSELRVRGNRSRDKHRKPLVTLEFFGLRDDMSVVELFTGYGYYAEILGPVLREKGKLLVTGGDPDGDPENPATKQAKYILKKKAEVPELWGSIETQALTSTTDIQLGPPGSVDLVLSFRNLANWMQYGYADKLLAAAFKALKPGGIFGVVDHRADPNPTDVEKGYVNTSDAIKLIEAVGFKLEDKSEISANRLDTKDHPKGVLNLPPYYADGDLDKEKYRAIGDTDRFTLKFRKP